MKKWTAKFSCRVISRPETFNKVQTSERIKSILSDWFLMMPSIATKFQYVNSPFLFFLLTHYMFRPLRAILRWDIQLDVLVSFSCLYIFGYCTLDLRLWFLPLGVASCCASVQLVLYDAINRNKVSIRQLPLFYFSFLLTICFGPYGPSSGDIYN
jgi:hypothetical protein